MADDKGNHRESEDQNRREHAERRSGLGIGPQSSYDIAEQGSPQLDGAGAPGALEYPGSLLGNSVLGEPGNAPVRNAVTLQAQRVYGNRAVQRYLQRTLRSGAPSTPVPVQRDGKGASAAPTVTVNATPIARTSYTVKAKTLKEAVAEIEAREEAGETTWKPKHTDQLDDDGNVKSTTITANLKIMMPNWPGAAKLGKADKAKWDKFMTALEKHEQGHVKIAKDKLKEIGQSMIGQSKADAESTFQSGVTDLQTASDDYDDKNDHGRNDGTTIDLD